MSFHWDSGSDDDEENEGLEALWTKAAQNQEETNDDEDNEDANSSNGLFAFDMALVSTSVSNQKSPPVARLPSEFVGSNDSGSEEDSVDWEDADNNHPRELIGANDNDGEQKPPAISTVTPQSLQPVTIHIGSSKGRFMKGHSANDKSDDIEKAKKQKAKTRRKYKFASLPHRTKFVLEHLHKSHWLALTSHIMFVSQQCSDELLLPVAYSLIPPCSCWWSDDAADTNKNNAVPELAVLKQFAGWYFDFIHNAETKRRQTLEANAMAGAPRLPKQNKKRGRGVGQKRKSVTEGVLTVSNQTSSTARLLDYCVYLAACHSEDPQLWERQQDNSAVVHPWSRTDQVNLFIAMTRSMGWRTRYVAAVQPVRKDLDLDHPMLQASMVNIFRAASLWNLKNVQKQNGRSNQGRPRKKAKELDATTIVQANDNQLLNQPGDALLGWAEVLCRVPNDDKTRTAKNSNNKQSMRWIHVDPRTKSIDLPNIVESCLFEHIQEQESVTKVNTQRTASRVSSRRRYPVAFVIAAEHHMIELSGQQLQEQKRKHLTDVTPRYASSMVETFKLRGIAPQDQATALSDQKNAWWSKVIRELNSSFKGKPAMTGAIYGQNGAASSARKRAPDLSKGKTGDNAIALLESDDEYMDDEESPVKEYVQSEPEDESDENHFEKQELAVNAKSETIPNSKEKFKNHPHYAIASVLKKAEVIAPDAKKRLRGFFKGEMVYSRSDVSEALPEKKWLYQGRKVRKSELTKPVKRVKARAKSTQGRANDFKALKSYGVGKENDGSAEYQQKQIDHASEPLSDGMVDLYAIWQTEKFKLPYVAANQPIPVNEYNNVELALMNPGLVHVDAPRVAKVAKQLGIPYAPCLLGFEGHNGNRAPIIRGIVVHEHNADLLREASVEVYSKSVEDANDKRRTEIYTRWKRLMVGVLTRQRLEDQYG